MDLAKHFIIYSSKAELDQFQSSLETLDTLNFMKKHAAIKSLFAQRATELTAQAMLTLFEINWSQSGTTARGIEEAVIVAWSEYVLNMKGTATTELILKCECCFSFTPNKSLCRWTIGHN